MKIDNTPEEYQRKKIIKKFCIPCECFMPLWYRDCGVCVIEEILMGRA
jgi:hypothetical protein